MRKVDVSAYSAKTPRRIKPEKINLGDLPPIKPVSDEFEEDSGRWANALPSHRTVEQPKDSSIHGQNGRVTDGQSNRTTELPNGSDFAKRDRSEESTVRYSFQILPDQLARLRRLVGGKMVEGEQTSISALVRAGIEKVLEENSE